MRNSMPQIPRTAQERKVKVKGQKAKVRMKNILIKSRSPHYFYLFTFTFLLFSGLLLENCGICRRMEGRTRLRFEAYPVAPVYRQIFIHLFLRVARHQRSILGLK